MTQSKPADNYQLTSDRVLNNYSSVSCGMATDASGNVFVTGFFDGQASFGSTTLMSAGLSDMYLAKWDVAAGTWAWAISGGGASYDAGYAIAVSGNSVYVTGSFDSHTPAYFAGTTLVGAGDIDVFVVKYTDNGSSVSNGWVVRGGGSGADIGLGLAIAGPNVYITGGFQSNATTTAVIAGASLTGAGGSDVFVAKYIDTGVSVSNGWATSGGGTGYDLGRDVALHDSTVYVTGSISSNANATIAGTNLPGAGSWDIFLAKYEDRSTGLRPGGAISGGGMGNDISENLAVSGPNVYIAGGFTSDSSVIIAGTRLPGGGGSDMFLAKYVDTSTALVNGWVTSGGGVGDDQSRGVVVSGAHVFVTGNFRSPLATIAGTAIYGAGGTDVFVAKYIDTGASARDGWATSGGALSPDDGAGIALRGSNVYATGRTAPGATFGSHTLNGPGGYVTFLAGLIDLSVGLSEESASTSPFTLSPNPAHHTVRLTNAPAATAEVVDALGRTVRTSDLAPLTADLSLHGLPPGLYVVRCGAATRRLVVE